MKTAEEIKKGLELCSVGFYENICTDCPYSSLAMYECPTKLKVDALAYIQQLEAKVKELERIRADMTATNMELRDAVFKQELHMRRLEEERSEFESRVHRWISVEERLPEDGQAVIVVFADRWRTMAWRRQGEWYTRSTITETGVTHWMPLPEPPKEGHND